MVTTFPKKNITAKEIAADTAEKIRYIEKFLNIEFIFFVDILLFRYGPIK